MCAVIRMPKAGETSGLKKSSPRKQQGKTSDKNRTRSHQTRNETSKNQSRARRRTIADESSNNAQGKRTRVVIISAIAIVAVAGIVAGVVLGTSAGEGTSTDSANQGLSTPNTNIAGPGGSSPTGTNPGNVKVVSYNESYWKSVQGECGVPRVVPELVSSRIVGGTEAKKHSWSWQISLVKYKNYGKGYVSISHTCGGTLVAPRFVISATHCFLNSLRTQVTTKPDSYRVVVGGHEKSKLSDGAKLVKIASIIHHPKNNMATFSRQRTAPQYDLTVLKLAQVLNPKGASPKISFACLPNPGVVPPAQKKCWVTGWGKTLNTGFKTVLKQAPQVIVSQTACNKFFGQISYEKHICVQQKSMGTCQGDSGGPLVCQGADNRWTLYGATSFGPTPCAIAPSVFANLPMMLEWVCCYLEGYGPCGKVRCRKPT